MPCLFLQWNQDAPMTETASTLRPANIEIDKTAQEIRITWNDGQVGVLAFDKLRAACPCAECQAHHADDNPLRRAMLVNVELESAQLVGSYAIQFQWADGHRFGIYAWQYLRSLS